MSELFSIYEAQVTTATNAGDALDLATCGAFDIGITDISLPDFDGYWLASRIKA